VIAAQPPTSPAAKVRVVDERRGDEQSVVERPCRNQAEADERMSQQKDRNTQRVALIGGIEHACRHRGGHRDCRDGGAERNDEVRAPTAVEEEHTCGRQAHTNAGSAGPADRGASRDKSIDEHTEHDEYGRPRRERGEVERRRLRPAERVQVSAFELLDGQRLQADGQRHPHRDRHRIPRRRIEEVQRDRREQ
jgi:hypothetical protein